MRGILRVIAIAVGFGGGFLAGSIGRVHGDAPEPVAVPMASWAAEPRRAPELVAPVDMLGDVDEAPSFSSSYIDTCGSGRHSDRYGFCVRETDRNTAWVSSAPPLPPSLPNPCAYSGKATATRNLEELRCIDRFYRRGQ